MLGFYGSLVEKTNCWKTAVFQSCFSFFLLPSWVNKETSFHLLENMLLLYTKLCAISFARDVKKDVRLKLKNWKMDR